jgi:hypothetical protein
MSAARADSAATPGAPRYSAEIPWIGPIVGAAIAGESGAAARVPLAGAADPRLGPALVAAFVPVVADAARQCYAPVDSTGAKRGLVEVGWVQDLNCDGDHWFGIEAEASALQGAFDGVLMVLLYDRSVLGDPAVHTRWHAQLALLRADAAPAAEPPAEPAALRRGLASPIAALPAAMRDEIARRLEELLAREPLETLRHALIELPGREESSLEITFAFSSCQFPWGMLDQRVAEASYRRLAARLDAAGPKPECLLLLGDQVYVDATAGLFDPSTRFDRFVLPYERLYRSRAVQDVLRRLPAYMLLDDHEIDDNWEPAAGEDARNDPHLREGRRAYLDFQRRATPPRAAAGDNAGDDDPLWFSFARGGFHFFMADTRTEREPRSAATLERARIMSEAQFEKLLGWLDEQDRRMPKFIATPSILLPRHLRAVQNGHPASALRSDGWDGYPRSLQRLLAHIADKQIRNVIFLSGDEHLSCVARATITSPHTGRSVPIHSIHSSALHAPYPFANSIPEDLVAKETFSFAPAGTDRGYRCAVSVERFIPGDGFAVLRVYREGDEWRLACEFDRAGGRAASPLVRLTLDA